MAKEVRASPSELGTLGQAFTIAGSDVRNGLQTAREDVTLTAGTFGNSSSAEGVNEKYGDVLEKAGQAMEDLADVADKMSDGVYQTAFAYQETDYGNAGNIDVHKV